MKRQNTMLAVAITAMVVVAALAGANARHAVAQAVTYGPAGRVGDGAGRVAPNVAKFQDGPVTCYYMRINGSGSSAAAISCLVVPERVKPAAVEK